jgi:hypothetical protein
MYKSLDELRGVLSDIQISFLQLSESGEDLIVGLIDYLGRESQVIAEGVYQLSISRVPGDRPSYTILSCTIEELADDEIEKRIPGYAITYVRWTTQTQSAIHLRLEGDVVIDLTCRLLKSPVA